MSKEQLIDGVRVLFERRKYGTGPSTKFFTWLMYRDGKEWETYGDPWPSSVIPKAQLKDAIADIKGKLAAKAEVTHG
jgi:hypothetical protein